MVNSPCILFRLGSQARLRTTFARPCYVTICSNAQAHATPLATPPSRVKMVALNRPAIIVHGGAGGWEDTAAQEATAGCLRAVATAAEILQTGGTALDATEAACCVLEDEPLYDAGIGSYLNAAGEVELDAIFVDGGEAGALPDFGAVAGLRRLQNPIRLARRILEERSERFFIGSGADALAAQLGLPLIENETLITAARRNLHAAKSTAKSAAESAQREAKQNDIHGPAPGGTVGVAVRDPTGRLAAATSTGGSLHKPPGRVGDSPLFGAGAYARAGQGAASATGDGECIMRALLTQDAVERLANAAQDAQGACEAAIHRLLQAIPDAGIGLILIDSAGKLGAAHSTSAMPHAWWDGGEIHSRFRCGQRT